MAIERLPLFPLKTVLMPGMVLPLRIFEPRYRLMMQRVLTGERRFGVLLIRRGAEVGPGAEPYDLGTVAVVTAVEPLGGGLMDVSATGSRRFRVSAFHHDEPYGIGGEGTVEHIQLLCRMHNADESERFYGHGRPVKSPTLPGKSPPPPP